MTTIKDLQNEINSWHDRQWGNPGVDRMGLKLAEEVGEVCEALIKNSQDHPRSGEFDLGAELADVFIVTAALSAQAGIDLQEEIEKKLKKLPGWRT